MAMRMESDENEVCIVMCPFESRNYQYYIYIVNLSNVEDVKEVGILGPPTPDVGISTKATPAMAFAVRDSVLYMFGGIVGSGRDGWGAESFAYTLPSAGTHSFIDSLKDESVKALPAMASPKAPPCAVLIGRRICVFSSDLEPGAGAADFELYNPDSNEWSPVPNLPIQSSTEVRYYYVEGLRLFLKTNDSSFVIDFGSMELEWGWCAFPTAWGARFPLACAKDGGLLFTPLLKVVDTEEREPRKELNIPGLIPRRLPEDFDPFSCNRAVTAMRKKENERLRVCVVQTGRSAMHLDDDDTAVAVHLIKFDAQGDPIVLKSHMFHMDPSILDDDHILFVFPLSRSS